MGKLLLLLGAALIILPAGATLAQEKERPVEQSTFYRTVKIDGLSIFYREAGPKDARTLLLLHGFPSSSRMYEPLFARLSDRYRLISPDYPGFGHSDWPDPKKYAYTFDHLAAIMDRFTEELGLSRYIPGPQEIWPLTTMTTNGAIRPQGTPTPPVS